MRERILSLWLPGEGRYTYFAVRAPMGVGELAAPIPGTPRQPPLGDAPERLLRVLPAEARPVGRGFEPRGEIVVTRDGRSSW